ncbi:hypothetical protein DUNSADRAFT_4571 [Dunaliella salina]|uniref:Encoded protein n=1 Tax=Dunaliella salina TaxID=3046 RepID=A0ABQ7GRS3_DUNSA|nr:hypothetical protein DUNSADRAFT_4571 [Dunaliella salina]|eukprot:KAF5837308.1 hypothetical protein DUNSADRAFT_4571 [Dunaliella salina]
MFPGKPCNAHLNIVVGLHARDNLQYKHQLLLSNLMLHSLPKKAITQGYKRFLCLQTLKFLVIHTNNNNKSNLCQAARTLFFLCWAQHAFKSKTHRYSYTTIHFPSLSLKQCQRGVFAAGGHTLEFLTLKLHRQQSHTQQQAFKENGKP